MSTHFGLKNGDLYNTIKGPVPYEDLPDWCGIDGVKLQTVGYTVDPRLWYNGANCSVYDIEEVMNEAFKEYYGENNIRHIPSGLDRLYFEHFVKEKANEVKALIERGVA